jgi:16S rRNA G527 N7-methylase RsmG
MIKSTVSRAKRREFVKFYKQRLKNTGSHYICYAADSYTNDFKVRRDVMKSVEHTLSSSNCSTIPTAFNTCGEKKRQEVRNKWLRVYAEQGVAYTPFEWLTKVDSRFAKWKSEVNKIAAKYNLVPAVIPSVREQEVWTTHYMDNLTPQQAWDATPW